MKPYRTTSTSPRKLKRNFFLFKLQAFCNRSVLPNIFVSYLLNSNTNKQSTSPTRRRVQCHKINLGLSCPVAFCDYNLPGVLSTETILYKCWANAEVGNLKKNIAIPRYTNPDFSGLLRLFITHPESRIVLVVTAICPEFSPDHPFKYLICDPMQCQQCAPRCEAQIARSDVEVASVGCGRL